MKSGARRKAEVPVEQQVPPLLLGLITSVEPVPIAMHKCRTLYEAVRVSRGLKWVRSSRRLGAVSTWVTAALLSNQDSQRYLSKLVTDELHADRWLHTIFSAVHVAVDEIDRLHEVKGGNPKDRKRAFLQNQNEAVRSLAQAATALKALGCNPHLTELLCFPEAASVQEAIQDVSRRHDGRQRVREHLALQEIIRDGVPARERLAELVNRGVFSDGDPIPTLRQILLQAIKIATSLKFDAPDRHGVRGMFLRSLYSQLEGSVIERNRTAFLVHSAKAVFEEDIDKSHVRRLVRDIADEKAAMNEMFEDLNLGNEWIEALQRDCMEDNSLQPRRSSRSSPGGASVSETSPQSRNGSGDRGKAKNESVPAKPSRRTASSRKPVAAQGSLPAHRKKP